jgi:hypothetical protein
MFANAGSSLATVTHRTTLIEQNHRSQIGFIFILPNIKAIGLAKQLPIDRTDLIAFNVLPVFLELDACTFVGRSMTTNSHAFDNAAS